MHRFLLIIVVFVSTMVARADNVVITGCVKNATGHPIADANVFASEVRNKNKVLTYSITSDNGRFSLSINTEMDSIRINVTGFNIAHKSVIVPNRPANITIVTDDETIVLPNIQVKSRKMYSSGDTINYNVASFIHKNDINIGEVLKRLPGISVSDVGQISYKGIPIKKFYIEGLDLMKGRYGIATNNIAPNNIATVQVLENHQDVKALKGLKPEEKASINLKLKSGVKGVFNLIATVGGGSDGDALWDNSVAAMRFSRKSQFFTTYKGNNTGEDLSNELNSFDEWYSNSTSALTSISKPVPPGISKSKYYFNRSHSATYNNVYRIGSNGELGINAAYWKDNDSRFCQSVTTHMLPDDNMNIVAETSSCKVRSQMVYGNVSYIENGARHYLNERLNFEYNNEEGQGDVFAGCDIEQLSRMENYRLGNKFHLTNRTAEEKGYEIVSSVNVEKRPHSLLVSQNLFPDVLAAESLRQDVRTTNISTSNTVRLLSAWVIGRFQFHPCLMFNYQHDGLSSHLLQYDNDLNMSNVYGGAAIESYAKYRHLSINAYLPLAYRACSLKSVDTRREFVFEPNVQISYKFNGCNEISLKAGITGTIPSVNQLYSQRILTSYRQMSSYMNPEIYNSKLNFYSVSFDTKDVTAMRFWGVDIKYNHYIPKMLYGYVYDGVCESVISRETKETTDMMAVTIRGSKGFNWKRMKVGFEGTYVYCDNLLLVQDEVMRYYNNSFKVKADFNISPFSWMNLTYDGGYGQQHAAGMTTIRTMTNKCAAEILLPADISLTGNLYHYYNNVNMGDKSFLMGDVIVKYTLKRLSFTLSLNNIFNRKQYSYSRIDALSSYISDYTIRPRSVILKVRIRLI